MLKPLKKKSKKIILFKIAFRDFIKTQIWIYLIVLASVALCSYIFNRWIEGIIFCIAHTCIRNAFDRQFHFNKTAYCLSLTMLIIWFAIPITLPVSLSLLSSIPIAFGISFVGFLAQDRIIAHNEISQLDARLNSILLELEQYKNIDLFNMPEDQLRQYAASQGLSENQIDILCMKIYQHLKISEICRYANYGRTTVKYHLEQIKRKLNIRTFP